MPREREREGNGSKNGTELPTSSTTTTPQAHVDAPLSYRATELQLCTELVIQTLRKSHGHHILSTLRDSKRSELSSIHVSCYSGSRTHGWLPRKSKPPRHSWLLGSRWHISYPLTKPKSLKREFFRQFWATRFPPAVF